MPEKSIGELLADLSRQTSELVRQEFELAKVELTSQVKGTARQGGLAAGGGVLAHAGLLVILAGIVLGIAQLGVDAWLAALIVGVLCLVIGYVLVNHAVSEIRRRPIVPRQTIETLKEARWTTHQRA